MKQKTKTQNEMMSRFKLAIISWEGVDKTMKHVYAQDRKDLMQVYTLMKKGMYKRAAKKAYWLDTIVRDQIPQDIYDFLGL